MINRLSIDWKEWTEPLILEETQKTAWNLECMYDKLDSPFKYQVVLF